MFHFFYTAVQNAERRYVNFICWAVYRKIVYDTVSFPFIINFLLLDFEKRFYVEKTVYVNRLGQSLLVLRCVCSLIFPNFPE